MSSSLLILGIEGHELTPEERTLIRKVDPAGFILFSRNIASPEQTRALTDSLRESHFDDPIIAIDQEGGRVTRTSEIAPALPSANDFAAQADPLTIANAGALTGDLLRLLGFNLNFAPVLDLDHHVGLANALRGRCWGTDTQRVIDHAGQWNRWMRKRGIRSCAKHFPAGGRATSDPHHDLPLCDADLEALLAEDIIPYTALMPELDAVMIGHVSFTALDPANPASLSRRVVTGLLREQLGFDNHLVLTDDLDMGAIGDRFPNNSDVTTAIKAGNDLAMICHRMDRVEDAAARLNELPDNDTFDSLKRVERFRKKLHAPLRWSDEKWRTTCDELTKIANQVPSVAADEIPNSPVVDY